VGFAIRQHEKMIGIAIISGLAMAAVSGCWWPLELTPPWMQRLGRSLPSGMALRAMHLLISYGRGAEAVWPHVLGLLAYAAGTAALFLKLLSRSEAA
jgi:ABC-type multidrug transport system permease subunit